MENTSKMNTVLLVIVIILLVAGLGYFFLNSSNENTQEEQVLISQISPTEQNSPNINPIPTTEDSTNEVFNNQPGAVKSIKTEGNTKWTLAIDLLSSNPKWLPGVDSTGGFFINQTTKIRNLNITTNTKAYRCDGSQSTTSTQISSFISYIQNTMIRAKTDIGILGEFGYTAYFDISGDNITAIYEQCLP